MSNIAIKKKKCETCSKEYQPTSNRQRYCSEACKRGTAKCLNCSKSFVPKSNTTSQYCSSKCWYAWLKSQNDAECVVCGKQFHKKSADQMYCSLDCAAEYRTKARPLCKQCGKSVQRMKNIYCSNACSIKARGIKNDTILPIGTVRPAGNGYMKIKTEAGWVQEHRYVMQEALGRPLEPSERVRHLNGKRDDNRLENLELQKIKSSIVESKDHHCAGCTCLSINIGLPIVVKE